MNTSHSAKNATLDMSQNFESHRFAEAEKENHYEDHGRKDYESEL